MNDEKLRDLAGIRYKRALELIDESELMLNSSLYKAANNRAFYAGEKALKALLALKGKDSGTHSGTAKLFNMLYINTPDAYFDREDYSAFQRMERIRSLSDYDDFYITSKAECEDQVIKATQLVAKVGEYLKLQKIVE